MKKEINVFDYAGNILKSLEKGILITTKSGENVNAMSIAWGSIGIEWNRPIFIAYVRTNRYTRTMLDNNSEFTINVPYGNYDSKIVSFCGRNSGKNVDKISELGLTLFDGDIISVPGIAELPLTLECRVVHKKLQASDTMPSEIKKRFYPEDVDSDFPGSNKDYHIAYYGEIVKAYIYEG